jgi:hypothetical protein
MIDLQPLRALAEKANKVGSLSAFSSTRADAEADLADACDYQTILSLLSELEAARRVVEAAKEFRQECLDYMDPDYEPPWQDLGKDRHYLTDALTQYAEAIK